jgi:putative CGCGG family rSAM target protein
MTTHAESHGHDDPDPITDRVHDTSWSANLERPHHGESLDRLLDDAVTAVEHTAPGYHVNLVTHGEHGHPSTYLYDRLEAAFGPSIEWAYVERCGCGGHVTRVHVGANDEE